MAAPIHQAALTQVGQVLRNCHLVKAEDALQMAHAQGRARQQVQESQPRLIAQAPVKFGQFHILMRVYSCIGMYLSMAFSIYFSLGDGAPQASPAARRMALGGAVAGLAFCYSGIAVVRSAANSDLLAFLAL